MENNKLAQLGFAFTRHRDDLQFYANHLSQQQISDLEETVDHILEIIYLLFEKYGERGIPQNHQSETFLNEIYAKIHKIRRAGLDKVADNMEKSVIEAIENENSFLKNFLTLISRAAILGITFDAVTDIAQYGIFNGGTIHSIFAFLADSDAARIHKAAVNAIKQTPGDLKVLRNAVKKEMGKTDNFVKSEIFNIVNGAVNDAALSIGARNNLKLIYSAVLDSSTCKHCRTLHGKVFDADDPGLPVIPAHGNCRCGYITLTGDIKQPEQMILNFKDYIAGLDTQEQKKRLGKDKFQAWKDGLYALSDYEYPMQHQTLTIKQLKKRDDEIFARIEKLS